MTLQDLFHWLWAELDIVQAGIWFVLGCLALVLVGAAIELLEELAYWIRGR